ncbi:ATP-dependent protease ATPase subunit HslU [Lacticaseibacillus pabuli]|uniref:ATP-dependent protease ATPase subunit HslU n=1 Tax=Lacticaseibacillus pabuli TaxID=3025672 RepID=A0ABY7WRA0_9LACO|nr:ATP-dependent protease ATPase subunit HslU [Lacticaseibacillus sp. KACC 23028]WDF81547.1 ATP-dependent protease ATPase subunit HslU [Lacticaseibacillus sp. KACC 23028]
MQTPKEIVAQLDQYVIGQDEAKKAVAVALYNRWRRMQLSEKMQQDITPKNLLMIGPTGVGKTEIARRLAKIVNAPFVKVEATKFTEVGYVGRDVESMIRDLVDVSVQMEEDRQYDQVRGRAEKSANKRLVKLLVPGIKKERRQNTMQDMMNMFTAMQNGENQEPKPEDDEVNDKIKEERMTVADQLAKGLLEQREVTIQMEDSKKTGGMNDMYGQMGIDLGDTLSNIMPKKMVDRTMTVKEAREILVKEESAKLVNHDDIYSAAIKNAQNNGIVFIDEIDKIAAGQKQGSGEVSREGVQRDILPIVEGSTVTTKYGPVDTEHMLFIGSGAFATAKPSDLIAELQGRFPIRVELKDLSEHDFVRILTEPDNALTKQYMALIGADGVKITFTQEAVASIAHIAANVNQTQENIGARRLATILEKLLEDILYEGPDMQMGSIDITEQYVADKVGDIAADQDLSRYIL